MPAPKPSKPLNFACPPRDTLPASRHTFSVSRRCHTTNPYPLPRSTEASFSDCSRRRRRILAFGNKSAVSAYLVLPGAISILLLLRVYHPTPLRRLTSIHLLSILLHSHIASDTRLWLMSACVFPALPSDRTHGQQYRQDGAGYSVFKPSFTSP
ncbi:hypothetical protein L226DRAFT_201998 [Lentinus tigrinus ALCF2SS1-7]|uniref:uncharacterized protein n=1 Tax=Lentinus tigrinus ALCF2SS1-7 TaxID=1328758 RepID=UPI001165F178|nr:hypothetical protein L226DRAFT_201998 [Lentinus tigrinus ALCF2SS1-7]